MDALTLFFVVYCLFYNLFLYFYTLVKRVGVGKLRAPQAAHTHTHTPMPTPERTGPSGNGGLPTLTIMIPALDEAAVLERTVLSLLSQAYLGRKEILIINDGSQDETPSIAEALAHRHANVYVLHRNGRRARRGKADTLNHGFEFLCGRFPERNPRRWAIGVFDADGVPVEPDFLQQVGWMFADPSTSAVQSGVRISNRRHLLAALQDVEFVTFSAITQAVRDGTSGAVALGGNGQFVRADCLQRLKAEAEGPWNPQALTEDLELGLKIHLAGGRIRFLPRHVEQEGVESLRALFRQRHRWAWGTLQVFTAYVLSGRLLRAPLPLLKKLDLHYYLSFWVVPLLVLGSLIVSALGWLGIWQASHRIPVPFLVANSFSFWPMMALGLRLSGTSWGRIPALILLTTLYSYHWVPLILSGWVRILARKRPRWAKTERVTASLEPAGQDHGILEMERPKSKAEV